MLLLLLLICFFLTCSVGDFRLVRDENISVSLIDNSTGAYIGFPAINSGLHIFPVDHNPVIEISPDFTSLKTHRTDSTVGITLQLLFLATDKHEITGHPDSRRAHFIIKPLGKAAIPVPPSPFGAERQAQENNKNRLKCKECHQNPRLYSTNNSDEMFMLASTPLVESSGPVMTTTTSQTEEERHEACISVFQLGLYGGNPPLPEVSSDFIDWTYVGNDDVNIGNTKQGDPWWDTEGALSAEDDDMLTPESMPGGGVYRVLSFYIDGYIWPANLTFEIEFDLDETDKIDDVIPIVYDPEAWKTLGGSAHADLMRFMSFESGWMSDEWYGIGFNSRKSLITLLLMHSILSDSIVVAVMQSILDRVLINHPSGGIVCLSQAIQGLCTYTGMDVSLLLPIVLDILWSSPTHKDIAIHLAMRYQHQLTLNAAYIVSLALKFALDPGDFRNLLRADTLDATWRDSPEGLAGSVYPMDLNAIYMPAALQALVRLNRGNIINIANDKLLLCAMRWELHSQTFFETDISHAAFDKALQRYVTEGIPGQPDLTPLLKRAGQPLSPIIGVGMTQDGTVIPLMTSDTAMLMLLRTVSTSFSLKLADMVTTYFPRGLRTEVGILASNPVYMWAHPLFNESGYVTRLATQSAHGLVAYRWHHTVWEASLMKRFEESESHEETLALTDALSFVRDLNSMMCSQNDLEATHWSFNYQPESDRFVKKPLSPGESSSPNVLALTSQVNLLRSLQLSYVPENAATPISSPRSTITMLLTATIILKSVRCF